jgi:hypothetical protein
MRQRRGNLVADALFAILVIAITAFGVTAAATALDLNVAEAISIALTSQG